jgi:hypothetical protein
MRADILRVIGEPEMIPAPSNQQLCNALVHIACRTRNVL